MQVIRKALEEVNQIVGAAGYNIGGPLGEWQEGNVTPSLDEALQLCTAFEESMKQISRTVGKALRGSAAPSEAQEAHPTDTERLDFVEGTPCCIGYNVELNAWGFDHESAYCETIRECIDQEMTIANEFATPNQKAKS